MNKGCIFYFFSFLVQYSSQILKEVDRGDVVFQIFRDVGKMILSFLNGEIPNNVDGGMENVTENLRDPRLLKIIVVTGRQTEFARWHETIKEDFLGIWGCHEISDIAFFLIDPHVDLVLSDWTCCWQYCDTSYDPAAIAQGCGVTCLHFADFEEIPNLVQGFKRPKQLRTIAS